MSQTLSSVLQIVSVLPGENYCKQYFEAQTVVALCQVQATVNEGPLRTQSFAAQVAKTEQNVFWRTHSVVEVAVIYFVGCHTERTIRVIQMPKVVLNDNKFQELLYTRKSVSFCLVLLHVGVRVSFVRARGIQGADNRPVFNCARWKPRRQKKNMRFSVHRNCFH